MINYCEGCFEKQQRIDQLLEENRLLKARLKYQERIAQEGFFGTSTPSSKLPFKANASEENRNHKGGAPIGHPGHGRKSHSLDTADEVQLKDIGDNCPQCGGMLKLKEVRDRTVIDIESVRPKRILYRLLRKECTRCHRIFRAKAPSVLPKSLYGNQLVAHVVVMHYFHGVPMGRITKMIGIQVGSLVDIFHRLSRYFAPIMKVLKEQYRLSAVKHADETGWRIDGENGYVWIFCTTQISLYYFEYSRSASIPRKIFGEKRLPGVLVVDRYNAYNRLPLQIQYCYAHLLRDVERLKKEFPDDAEVKSFVSTLASLLAQAMHLRSQPISDEKYYKLATEIKEKIIEVSKSPAKHLGIRAIQDIFNTHSDRMYHWVDDRNVPADNNLSERDLRPTVIARKVSFGNGSDAGAKTRSILTSVLYTLNKCCGNKSLESVFKDLLDKLAENPKMDVTTLFPKPQPPP